MSLIATIKNALFSKFQGAPGESLSVDLSTYGDNTDNAELYHAPGSIGVPQDEEIGLVVESKGLNIVVATHNYKIVFSLEKGEHMIYSYDDVGNILSSAKCNAAGEFVINDGMIFAARKDDPTLVDNVTDSAFISWIAAVSAFINGLVPGTIPVVPVTVTGKINDGTDKVLLP